MGFARPRDFLFSFTLNVAGSLVLGPQSLCLFPATLVARWLHLGLVPAIISDVTGHHHVSSPGPSVHGPAGDRETGVQDISQINGAMNQ